MGIHTIGDIAAWPAADLARRFGQHGEDLTRRARGDDDRPIVTEHAAKSISQETTFAQDVRDRAKLERTHKKAESKKQKAESTDTRNFHLSTFRFPLSLAGAADG